MDTKVDENFLNINFNLLNLTKFGVEQKIIYFKWI